MEFGRVALSDHFSSHIRLPSQGRK
jgi:hypothetical protein